MSKPAIKFRTTKGFANAFAALPANVQKRTLEKLALYENNPRHPSLRVKKIQGAGNIWEMSVTKSYRITFQRKEEIVLLRNIGTHDILRTGQ